METRVTKLRDLIDDTIYNIQYFRTTTDINGNEVKILEREENVAFGDLKKRQEFAQSSLDQITDLISKVNAIKE